MNVTSNRYGWKDNKSTSAHTYLLPAVKGKVKTLYPMRRIRILDLGCGNGYVASQIAKLGHKVIGIDISQDGIDLAEREYPQIDFKVSSIYDQGLDDLVGESVDCVISLEVVEHLFFPKRLFEQSYQVLKKRGYLIVSTPYHGYWKNLATSLLNRWDSHFTVDRDGGHIKFFSIKTLARMALNAGFKNPSFQGVGRIPFLWKSIIMTVKK